MKLPDRAFYLFGMGNRRKLLYRAGRMVDVFTAETLRSWRAAEVFLYYWDKCN